MKIAVLLRGQSRFSSYGAHLFHAMVKNRFPEIEFKIFANTWKSISTVMTAQLDKNSVVYGREYNQQIVDAQDIYQNELLPWGGSYSINNESDLFHTVIEITHYLTNDEKLKRWWYDHCTKYKLNYKNVAGSKIVLPADEWGEISRSKFELFEASDSSYYENSLLKASSVQLHYTLGQVFSAGKSYELFEAYTAQHPEYQPDLIWSTRFDAVHWFDSARQFSNLIKNVNDSFYADINDAVLVDQISVVKNSIALNDYNFYLTGRSAKAFFTGKNHSTVEENLIALFTRDKHHLLPLIGAGQTLQHALWAAYARDCAFQPVNHSAAHETTLLRSSVDFSNIQQMPPTYETFKNIQSQSLQYYYPTINTPPSKKMISDAFQQLLEN